VSVIDIMAVAAQWGTADPQADVNDDGTVNIADVQQVAGAWRKTCHELAETTKYYTLGGRRVAMQRAPVGQASTLYYLFTDHLGSTSVVYNTATGQVQAIRYYPWGGVRSGEVPTDRRFTEQRWDGTIGLYDYKARWYDPALGRFVQADPTIPDLANSQALNRYSYTLNNPLRYVDPDGRIAWDVVDAIFFAISAYEFATNPSWANAGWLALDTLSLLLVVPSVGYLRYGDEALDLYNRIARVVGRGGVRVGEDLLQAVRRFGRGNNLFPSGAQVARQFLQIADIPGSERLLRQLATMAFPQVKGPVFQLEWLAAHADEVVEIETPLGGRRSIDVVLKDGTFVDFKNYDWSKWDESGLRYLAEKFAEQLKAYQKHTDQVKFIFRGSVPDIVREYLEKRGAIVEVYP
jgi:RHS repeat-associated protein